MLQVKQFRYAADNLGYLIYGNSYALAIDGGASEKIISFLKTMGLNLLFVANTHTHPDHTTGNSALVKKTKARLLIYSDLPDNGGIELEGRRIHIYHTPGHSYDSLCFHIENVLITGDTFFNGTIGNCFTGDIRAFYLSIKRIMSLPGNTIIYAGHDYLRDAMAFAKHLEPNNGDIDIFLENYDPGHVYSTLQDEMKVNPYLRFNDEKMIAVLRKKGLPCDTEWERWQALMSLE
ncbi:MAG: hydroxyacylglutathione hydrolase C-terminal domain-containing protein [Syntrophales bacterium]|nr:hydroxyacylglutathione hydrolase C-terminal domain-containing protein [Syntrophales bacterium]